MTDKVPLNMLETPLLKKIITRGGSLVFQFSNGKSEVVANITSAAYSYILTQITPVIDAGIEGMPRSVINPDVPKVGVFKITTPLKDGSGNLGGAYKIEMYIDAEWRTLINVET